MSQTRFNISEEDINHTVDIGDPILRNLLITQHYSELAFNFEDRMHAGANWCTFATWASKQAGQTIRHEDLKRTLENLMSQEADINAALTLVARLAKQNGALQNFEQLRKSGLAIMASKIADRASDAVSRGNKKVFDEIAREFYRFQTCCLHDDKFSESHISAFTNGLREGLPPNGQDYLKKAFQTYYQALFEADAAKKCQQNHLANLYVGFHEQNRLQPEIEEALDASLDADEIQNLIFTKLFSTESWLKKSSLLLKRLFGTSLLEEAIASLVSRVQIHIRKLLTHHLMTITMPPNTCIHLGRDLQHSFAAGLQTLTNPGLISLLSDIDPTPDSLLASGAADWANLKERMHYIADMFRCYQDSTELYLAPFNAQQTLDINNGRVPAGPL